VETAGLGGGRGYVINSQATLIARGQMMPSAMAVDGTRVYWSAGNCAINATSL